MRKPKKTVKLSKNGKRVGRPPARKPRAKNSAEQAPMVFAYEPRWETDRDDAALPEIGEAFPSTGPKEFPPPDDDTVYSFRRIRATEGYWTWVRVTPPDNSPGQLSVQVGGSHYKDMPIQPVEFITRNKLSFLEGCIIKRISRWRSKNGIEDLRKAIHEIELLSQLEGSDVNG